MNVSEGHGQVQGLELECSMNSVETPPAYLPSNVTVTQNQKSRTFFWNIKLIPQWDPPFPSLFSTSIQKPGARAPGHVVLTSNQLTLTQGATLTIVLLEERIIPSLRPEADPIKRPLVTMLSREGQLQWETSSTSTHCTAVILSSTTAPAKLTHRHPRHFS